MFLYLGEEISVYKNSIIGIFNIENTSVSKITKAFLSKKNRDFISVSYDMPESFVVCSDRNIKEKVFISHISSATLRKRTEKRN